MEIDQDTVPSSVEAAVDSIIVLLGDEDYAAFENPCVTNATVHHTIGRYLRNEWSLWGDDTPLKRDAVEKYGIAHADDISALIIEWVFVKIQGDEFDAIGYCRCFHDHWESYGTNSLAAGGWPPGGQ